eukprot:6752427-Alexandrium_andersonii.AAC.1
MSSQSNSARRDAAPQVALSDRSLETLWMGLGLPLGHLGRRQAVQCCDIAGARGEHVQSLQAIGA